MGGQNIRNSRGQSVTTISPENVGTLKRKWVFTAGSDVSTTRRSTTVRSTCLTGVDTFWAVDASNSALQWSKAVETRTAAGPIHLRTPHVRSSVTKFNVHDQTQLGR